MADSASEKWELLYFEGCPNASKLRALLERLEVPFAPVDQNTLSDLDSRRAYSSPTLLHAGEIIYGVRTDRQSSGCTFGRLNESELEKIIQDRRESESR